MKPIPINQIKPATVAAHKKIKRQTANQRAAAD
jgi:hypothetical protein